ncbi:hypothetical protein QIS99_00030 [Streptomyces sp. B-S-A8]|uniref:pPIWI-RE three-gene island domain-containing protein n=1 Tax=Streptomyces solicavernae TaxID=3043614 RepID=A0ABT6RJL1_9ACTN|nr:hypothetical protein [Streptomyces sp. B-S-A8]MDI3384618.1 hypothetical protein [Streptomyces sp. B-S-A8]
MARSRVDWRRSLIKQLKKPARQAGISLESLRRAIAVEFGLYALSMWAPETAARDGWALLKGYDFRPHSALGFRTNSSVRWLIGELKKDQDWHEALEQYEAFPEHLRLYTIKDSARPAVRRELTHARDRVDAYAKALSGPPKHQLQSIDLAEPDVVYRFTVNGEEHRLQIPRWLIPEVQRGHGEGRKRRGITLTWSALMKTAASMDSSDASQGRSNNWHGRVCDLQLRLRKSGRLRPARRLTIEDMVHLVGMPAVGKTTLLTVFAVWAARRRHTLTLVLGDVIAVLNMVEDLNRYVADSAAPILGASTRGQHLRQLHRPPDVRTRGLQLLQDDRLRWVSTACPAQGLLADLSSPLPLGAAPCHGQLELVAQPKEKPDSGQPKEPAKSGCPLFFSCGRHEAARALVKAPIWVATAQSLLHCRVPPQLTDKSQRYLELAWGRSDAFAFDEADRVQIQLDQIFSPSQTLAGPSKDAWLDEVRPLFEQHNRSTHGKHLTTSATVRGWSIDINSAGMLVARLRNLLAEYRHVREWLREGYFNEWQLAIRLAGEIARRPHSNNGEAASQDEASRWRRDEDVYSRWREVFREWLQDPAGRYKGDKTQVAFLRDVAARGYDDPTRINRDLMHWLDDEPDVIAQDTEVRRRMAVRLQVTITVALLAQNLARLTRYCWEVESEIGAESMSSSLVHRPPTEYLPLVPESPMGNLLGFQYREDDNGPADRLGALSFFRCSGIGRWLLLNLPHLYAGSEPKQQPGPGVLLLSATSWAGNSPRYDVQVPVTGILSSRAADKVPIDQRIVCEYLPSRVVGPDGKTHDRIVSGLYGDRRSEALSDVLADLCTAQPGLRGARPSTLERIRGDLEPGRRRLLLLVGNYQEAKLAHRKLVELRPEWADQILHMVPDDERGTHHWASGSLARSRVSTLAQHEDVWILITPMLAIERGHNILNDDHVAALGAALYLVRPHLHPEDLSYHIENMNRWAVEQILAGLPTAGLPDASLGERAGMFSRIAHRRWTDLLEDPLRYAYTETDSAERRAMDWTNIAPLNQIVGRLLRGAATARIYFCDGAFAPTNDDSTLLGMYRAMDEAMSGRQSDIAIPLYEPLKYGLHTLLEKFRGDV